MLGWGVVQAQVAVVAPSLELQEAMNHAEQLQQMVQTYQTMVNVKDGINKGIDAVEKVNNKLANTFAMLAMLGVVISFFSSVYIGYSLTEYGYKLCSRSSWMSPNEYVKDIKLCP